MTKSEAFRNLLQSQEFVDEINAMKGELLDQIMNSDDSQVDLREMAYIRIKTINEIMARLNSIANDDKIKDSAWKIL